MKEHEKHLFHYLVLIVFFVLSSVVFAFVRYNYIGRLILVISVCVFYALWGIIHHAVEGRLTKVIALEYILISVFVLILLLTYIVP